MKKVLFVSYCFPPLLLPESIQTSRCIKFLPKYGWEPYVVCVDERTTSGEPIDRDMMSLLTPDMKIIKVKSFEPRVWIEGIARFLPFSLKLPDSKIGWYWPAYKKSLSVLKKGTFSLIHSWAMYLTSNLVGLKLKKETGLPWVAHFSDPWVDNAYHHYGKLTGRINLRLERAVMENADTIVFVSEETRELVMKKYPSQMFKKAFVIPHGYDLELFDAIKKVKNKKLTFTYTGAFYYGVRTPIPLFKAIRNISLRQPDIHKFINVQIIGRLHKDYIRMISEFKIDKIITPIDTVPYLESLRYIVNADILLLIDAPSGTPSVFLPSKLIEYIASKNPILGITPLKGTSAKLIKSVGGIIVSPDDIKGIEQGILTLYENYKSNGLLDYCYPEDKITHYDAINTTKILAQLFDSVSRQ